MSRNANADDPQGMRLMMSLDSEMNEDSPQDPQDDNARAMREVLIASLAASLLKKRDEAVSWRASTGVEREWREAQRAFDGKDSTSQKSDMLDFATGEAWLPGKSGPQGKRSRVIVNIIRGKCETTEGRFAEILLPTDDRNWGLLNTRVPEASDEVSTQQPAGLMQSAALSGQAMPAAQQPDQVAAKKLALEKCRGLMEEEIDDQLSECGFNGECRKVVRSAIRLGTGILKGPCVVKNQRKAWIEQGSGPDAIHVMQVTENTRPASKWKDVWDVFPDPLCGNDPQNGAYIWDRDYILPHDVQALIGLPGYDNEQLRAVLMEPATRVVVTHDKGGSHSASRTQIDKGGLLERWEYNGYLTRDELELLGCECMGDSEIFSACVVFVNDRPVKAVRNMLDTGDLPFDFFQWVQSDDLPWGMGEPMKIIWQQRIITAAWREMMNNAGASSGPILAMSKDMEPEDDDWTVRGNSVWINNSDEQDIRAAFQQFQIQNNQVPLQNIIELALRFIDLESGTPNVAQGEAGHSNTGTLGEMQLLLQGADTGRRTKVKQWDDQITSPHIGRYYHWNMQYNTKRSIKGDYEIDARGTSVLLTKDQSAQRLMSILQLRNDPEVNIQVDWGKAIRQLFQAVHLDILKSDSEVEAARKAAAQQPPPEDPRITAAKIMAGSREKIEQMEAKEINDRLMADAQMALNEQHFIASEAEKDRVIERMRLAGASDETLQKLKVALADTNMKLGMQEKLSRQAMQQANDHETARHTVDVFKHRNPATPPTEPVGRAPTGQSFQR